MAPRLQPPDASALLKRTRSADNSNRSTPTAERIPSAEDAALPRFLRQSEDELDERFELLDLKQRERLFDHQRTSDLESEWTQIAGNAARARNRYWDIRPWDKTRVKLKVPDGSSDYINASPILLQCSKTGQERRYIATQGPKETSVDHFWQMVWHETDQHAVVIMLTQLVEGFKEKCYQYFPEADGSSPREMIFTNEEGEELAAELCVLDSTFHEHSKTTIRTLRLTCDGESKDVHHLLFLGWPDFGVPLASDRIALLELIRLSRDKNLGWDNPRIVHCSAGVGRTGSFIAIEHLMEELGNGSLDSAADDADPVFETIEALRQQRMTMVQSIHQYKFIYQLLADASRARATDRAVADGIQSMSTGMLSPTGEPAHKAMRFSRAVTRVWSNLRSRSSSRQPPSPRGKHHGDSPAPASRPVSRGKDVVDSPTTGSRPVSSSSGAEAGRPCASSIGTEGVDNKDVLSEGEDFHDAAESFSERPSADFPEPHDETKHSQGEGLGSLDAMQDSQYSAVEIPAIIEPADESQLPDAHEGTAESLHPSYEVPEIVESTVESQLPDALAEERVKTWDEESI